MNNAPMRKQIADLTIGDGHFDKLLEKANIRGYARGYSKADKAHKRRMSWADAERSKPPAKDLHTEVEVLGQLEDETVTLVNYWPALQKWTAWRPHMGDPDVRVEVEVRVRFWRPKPAALLDEPPRCNCKARSDDPSRHWIECPWRQHVTGDFQENENA